MITWKHEVERLRAEIDAAWKVLEAGLGVARSNDLSYAIADALREVAGPAARERCSCCRSCGPAVPCLGAVRATTSGFGGCDGLCYCPPAAA